MFIENQYNYIIDKYGRKGTLINAGEYYGYQPIEISDNHSSILDRSVPVDFKPTEMYMELPVEKTNDGIKPTIKPIEKQSSPTVAVRKIQKSFELLLKDKAAILALKGAIIKSNVVYVGQQFINNYLNQSGTKKELLEAIFTSETQDLSKNTKKILVLLSALKDTFSEDKENHTNSKNTKGDGSILSQFDRSLHIEFIYHYTIVFRKLLLHIEEYPALKNNI